MSKKKQTLLPPEPKFKELPAGEQELSDLLISAVSHLDWIGWGDRYERECIDEDRDEDGLNLEQRIKAAVERRRIA